ncbi:MAG TPA: hypothetical protein VF295_03000, partial [Candidatus Limnocylindria bacterium]
LALITAFNLAFTGPISVGLPWLAEERFAGGSAAFGLLFSAWGGGALLGAVIGGSVGQPRRFGSILLGIALALGAGLALIGLAPTLALAFGLIGVMGVLAGFVNVQYISWLQQRVADDVRGRMMSLVTLSSIGLAPISLAAAGALIDIGAATTMYLVAGSIVLMAALAGLVAGVPNAMEREAPR